MLLQLDGRIGTLDEKIRKLDVELAGYKQQLNKTRAGSPAQNVIKQKAMRVLKQKKMYVKEKWEAIARGKRSSSRDTRSS